MSRFSFIALVFCGISLGCFAALKFIIPTWMPFMWIPLGLAALFFVAALVKDFATLRDFLSMKTTKSGMNMGVMILLVVGILVLINVLAVRNPQSIDMTTDRINSLSLQSTDILKKLTEEIHFKFFYAEGESGLEQERAAFRQLVRKYQNASSRVELEYIDMNERPDLAEEYEVRQGGGIVFVEYQGRRNRIDKITEQDLTGAILKVTKDKKKIAYFVEGHGEADLFDANTTRGAAKFRQFLDGNQYDVKSIGLLEAGRIPDDASVVAVIGPTQTFLSSEVDALREYLARGGSLFVGVDPDLSHGLDDLFQDVGVEVSNYPIGFVLFGRRVQPTIASVYSSVHPATKVFKEKTATAFRFVSSIKKSEKVPEGIKFDEIVRTPASSFEFESTTGMETRGQGPHTVIGSFTGKMNFAASPESKEVSGTEKPKYGEKEFKMIVAADTDFLRNQLIAGQFNNNDLALNLFAYLAGEEESVTIRPPQIQRTPLDLNETNMMVFTFGFIIPLPLLLLGLSIFLGIKRRHS